jgi:hypothetical protein
VDPIYLSPSALKLWTECQRKWGFRYLEHDRQPPGAGALLGAEVQDTQLDPYLATGRPFDFDRPSGEIANALVPLIPAPGTPGLVLRRKFEFPSPKGGYGYWGELDLWAPDSSVVPGLGGAPLVGDFKTTKNLDYALSAEDLRTDFQAQLYAMTTVLEDDANEVDLVWWYVRTRKPHRTQRVHLRVTAEHVVDQFQRIEEIATEPVTIRRANPKVQDLPPNPRMCDQYGGCPYRHKCNLSPAVFAGTEIEMSTEATKSFLDTLRAKVNPAEIKPAPGGNPHPMGARTDIPEEKLPAWATAPVDPLHAKPAINPPEAVLAPAPPEKAKRTRKTAEPSQDNEELLATGRKRVSELAAFMKEHGVRRLTFSADGVSVLEIELA